MFNFDVVKENLPRFLIELYHQSHGEASIKVSMYDIGEALGLDRKASLRTAEELIGTGMAEVITLNGGIAITEEGVTEALQLGASPEEKRAPGTPTV